MGELRITLARHATLLVSMAQTRILVDPMLGPAGGQPPIPETPNPRPNPLVELPMPAGALVLDLDLAVVTHLHPDHLDREGAQALVGGPPVLCQGREAPALEQLGLAAEPLDAPRPAGGVTITPTGGRHGHGPVGQEMGPVMGLVIEAPEHPVLYVAGDTVWCEEVERALGEHGPDVVVVNAGSPSFVGTEPITMNAADVVAVARAAPEAVVVPVHLEAFNHCVEDRAALRAAVDAAGVGERVHIPADGETLALTVSQEAG